MKMGGKSDKPLIVKGKRLDGRKFDELRPIKIEAGVLQRADGSCYLEWGKNKVMAAVYGPRELHPKHRQQNTQAVIRCRYNMAPFSVDDRKRPGPDRRRSTGSEKRKTTTSSLRQATRPSARCVKTSTATG